MDLDGVEWVEGEEKEDVLLYLLMTRAFGLSKFSPASEIAVRLAS
jgi:hypothetical protein